MTSPDPVLMEEGGWSLLALMETGSYLFHKCADGTFSTTRGMVVSTTATPCIHCRSIAPEALQTLWALHNWDRIPGLFK